MSCVITHVAWKYYGSTVLCEQRKDTEWFYQGCALAEPGGSWRLTFALGRLENLRFFTQIICWAP